MQPQVIIPAFDDFLVDKGLRLDAVIIGGSALGLLGITSRHTRDCDVLHPSLTPEILNAATEFAVRMRASGEMLDDGWLNEGPASLTDVLPAGWVDRTQNLYQGSAITLRTLGRIELLMSKVFALCDRGIDLQDCILLAPTDEELDELLPWLEQQDANPDWPTHVRRTVSDLRRRLGHGV